MANASPAFDSLVGVSSTEQPSLNRIEAFDPENSYLVHKIENRPGITGSKMPPSSSLTAGEKDTFLSWIIGGGLE